MGKIIKKRVEFGGSSNSADKLKYDDTKNIKEAIDEVNENLAKLKTDKELDGISILSIEKNGEYYVTNALDVPSGVSTHGHVSVSYRGVGGENKVVKYIPNNTVRVFVNVFYGSWLGWEELTSNSDLSKLHIRKAYNEGNDFSDVLNDIASNIADGESAHFTFLIHNKDYYFGYMSKFSSTIYGGHFVSLGGINYKFTSAIGAVQI